MNVRNPEQGFTLLELMISLAVMAMIALMIGASMSAGSRILSRSAGYSAAVEEALARKDLRTYVEATLPSAFPGSEQPQFQGSSETFQFEAIVDNGTFWPGSPVKGTLAKQQDGRIVLTLTGLSDADQSELLLQSTLTGPKGQLDLAYFGRRSAEESLAWHTDWPTERGLPDLVKLVLSDGDHTLPPLIIRPAKRYLQSEMSLSSLVPPATPSRP